MSTVTASATDRLLAGITTAGFPGLGAHADDARLDATVPGWRFERRGADSIEAQFAQWYVHESQLEEVSRHELPTGEVVEITVTWVDQGVPHAARQVHVLTIDRDRDLIVDHRVWCGGQWPAQLLAEMEAARHDG
jgi:hypothetical protein